MNPSTRNLLVRTLSACLFVPLVLLLVHAGRLPLLFLVLFITGRGAWEFYFMARRAGRNPLDLVGVILSLAVGVMVFFLDPRWLGPGIAGIVLLVCAATLARGTGGYTANAMITVGGVLYLGLLGSTPLLILQLASRAQRVEASSLLGLLFLCIWLTDAAAYLVGRGFGRRKLAPGISPGKTVVGFVAGIGGGLMPAFLHRLVPSFGPAHLLGLLLMASLAGQVGDLVESAIKRDMGAKDAPSLIPGHGGVLDRFDSYLFAFPVAYLYILLLRIF